MANYNSRINWRKEARLLPGYIIVVAWVVFTAVVLFWIFAASLSTSREIFSGAVLEFASGFHWENYATAWTPRTSRCSSQTPCSIPPCPAPACW